jgi:hypothetical protein
MLADDKVDLVSPNTLLWCCPQQSASGTVSAVIEKPLQALRTEIGEAVIWIVCGYDGNAKAHVMLSCYAIDKGNRFLRLVHQLRRETSAEKFGSLERRFMGRACQLAVDDHINVRSVQLIETRRYNISD